MAKLTKLFRVQIRMSRYPYTKVNHVIVAKSHGDALERVMRKIIGWRWISGESFITSVNLVYKIDMKTGKTF